MTGLKVILSGFYAHRNLWHQDFSYAHLPGRTTCWRDGFGFVEVDGLGDVRQESSGAALLGRALVHGRGALVLDDRRTLDLTRRSTI